ncbi:MAG: hypothetical protein ACREOO_20695 [bacterium]
MKDYQWLAEIRVRVDDKKYSLSTGVPLSRRYVLTTGHGVPKPDDDKLHAEIRFIADFHNSFPWCQAKTVWHGGKTLDAALLEISENHDLHSVSYTTALPRTTTPWEGAGFPAANKISEGELAGERDSKGLRGVYSPGGNLKSQELDLTVESPPDISGKWAGISGAPVFCEGKLIGIIKSCPESFKGFRLCAVPMSLLLANADLRKLLGYDEREKLLAQKQARVVTLLAGSEEVLAALHAQPALHNTPKQPLVLAEALLHMDVGEFVRIVYQASGEKNVLGGKERQAMEEVLGELLPLLYDPGVVESVRLNLHLGVLFSLPAATAMIAEIIMAGIDRRPALYRKPVPGEEFPVGSPVIELPPECGFSTTVPDVANAFDEHLFNKFAPADRDKVRNLDELRTLVNDELEYIATLKKPFPFRHYFICPQPAREADRHTLMTLEKHYPQLFFITLTGDSLRSERKPCRPLRDFFAPKPGVNAA